MHSEFFFLLKYFVFCKNLVGFIPFLYWGVTYKGTSKNVDLTALRDLA